ncbi:MAG: hypothetical protein PVI26_10770 [Chitinispirillia bacterium]|jgi:hypothetical protein
MNIFKRKIKPSISPEKIVTMAEKGYKIPDLSKSEKKYLLYGGLEEINAVKSYVHKRPDKSSSYEINRLLKKWKSEKPSDDNRKVGTILNGIHIKLHEKKITILELSTKWNTQSLAFDHKGQESDSVSFSENLSRHTIHVEILGKTKNTVDINIRLADKKGKYLSNFEVELYKRKVCILSNSSEKNNIISLYSVEFGKYKLKVSDSKECLTSIPIHLE